jgi:hypothetical protein
MQANPDRDDWLDDVLRDDANAQREGYVDDAGFTASVMASLPAPVSSAPPWRAPVVATLWGVAVVASMFALPGAAIDFGREAFRWLAAQPFSLPQVAALLAAAGLATYAGAALALRHD